VDYEKLILIFTSIIYEALPFIVLGVLLAGLLEEFVPQQFIARLIPRRRSMHVGAIAVGGVLGLIFPMCECGIIVVMRRLLRKGVPLSVCLCYMLAGPIINFVVITSTAVAFQKDYSLGHPLAFVVLRVGLGFIVAFTTCLIVDWQHRKHGSAALLVPMVAREAMRRPGENEEEANRPRRSVLTSVANITETALNDFIDIMAFLVLGAMIAAMARVMLPSLKVEEWLTGNPVIPILLMMGFAIVFCLCSEADAFVAANFQPMWLWPASSKIAFLVLGPMLDIKLILMYTRVFRRRLILTIIACVVSQVFVYSLAVHYLAPLFVTPGAATSMGK
jgi:uncharacterized membrane protein YraQ (UPF0718 family)